MPGSVLPHVTLRPARTEARPWWGVSIRNSRLAGVPFVVGPHLTCDEALRCSLGRGYLGTCGLFLAGWGEAGSLLASFLLVLLFPHRCCFPGRSYTRWGSADTFLTSSFLPGLSCSVVASILDFLQPLLCLTLATQNPPFQTPCQKPWCPVGRGRVEAAWGWEQKPWWPWVLAWWCYTVSGVLVLKYLPGRCPWVKCLLPGVFRRVVFSSLLAELGVSSSFPGRHWGSWVLAAGADTAFLQSQGWVRVLSCCRSRPEHGPGCGRPRAFLSRSDWFSVETVTWLHGSTMVTLQLTVLWRRMQIPSVSDPSLSRSRCSEQTWSLPWSSMTPTSWTQTSTTCWRTPGDRSGRRGSRCQWALGPSPSLWPGRRTWERGCPESQPAAGSGRVSGGVRNGAEVVLWASTLGRCCSPREGGKFQDFLGSGEQGGTPGCRHSGSFGGSFPGEGCLPPPEREDGGEQSCQVRAVWMGP